MSPVAIDRVLRRYLVTVVAASSLAKRSGLRSLPLPDDQATLSYAGMFPHPHCARANALAQILAGFYTKRGPDRRSS